MHIKMYVIYVICLCVLLSKVIAHPQCRDTGSPFPLPDTNVFCDMYANFTCCTSHGNDVQQIEYNNILTILEAEGTDQICAGYAKQLLCQDCSPWVVHVFDLNEIFPDVCPEYCAYIYENCNTLVNEIMDIIMQKVGHDVPELRTAFSESSESFCARATNPSSPYCYPEIIDNTDLSQEVDRVSNSEDGCLCLKQVADKISNPIRFATPPNDYNRFFVSEQKGLIHDYDGQWNPRDPPYFLNLDREGSDLINLISQENGLFGLCFDEDYVNTGKIYIMYTLELDVERDGENCFVKNRVSSFLTKEGNPNNIDYSTEKIILEQCRPSNIHTAGELLCQDGHLFVYFGDGGPEKDSFNNGQNPGTWLAAMLKIDPSDPSVPYRVSPTNPHVNKPAFQPEVHSIGLRNPYRVSVDPGDPETGEGCGDLYIGDVGQAKWEEIDIMNIDGDSKNFGWRGREGPVCYTASNIGNHECHNPEYEEPVFSYPHGEMGTAVIGGHVYRGCLYPALRGYYFWGDWSSGKVFKMRKNGTGPVVNQEITMCGEDICHGGITNQYGRYVMGFGRDNDGEIYLMTSDSADQYDPSGKIYQIVDPSRSSDPSLCNSRQANPPTATGCPHLTSPNNGHVKVQVCAKKAHYMCFYGYIIVGDTERDCVDGVWTGTEPVCNEALCDLSLPDPWHGHVVNNQKVATYLCDEGYQVNGKPARFCLDGNWTGSQPTCVLSGSLPANYIMYPDTDCPSNDLSSSDQPSVHACAEQCTANLQCLAFVYTATNCQLKADCLNRVNTVGTKIHIKDVSLKQVDTGRSCPAFKDLHNKMKVSYTNGYNPGSKASFHCGGSKFEFSGDSPLTCVEGKWNKPTPKCIVPGSEPEVEPPTGGPPLTSGNSCPALSGLHSKMSVTYKYNKNHGSVATFTCKGKKYKLVGNDTQTCDNGTWTGTTPTCQVPGSEPVVNPATQAPSVTNSVDTATQGPPVTDPADNTATQGPPVTDPVDNTATQGPPVTDPAENTATQSPPVTDPVDNTATQGPPVVGADCPQLTPNDKKMKITTSDGYKHGSSATYKCRGKTRTLQGDSKRLCQNGVWTGTQPDCVVTRR